MRTWSAVVMGILLAGAIALVVWKAGPSKSSVPAVADGGTDAAAADATAAPTTTADPDGGAPVAEDAGEPDPGPSDAGSTMLDGSAAPSLAAEAPKQVTFGVIIVTYRGAQAAPPNARTREEALAIANQIAVDAKADFKAAVAKGDKGSMENAGRMPRGMLEPAPEFTLFSLKKGEVSEPVDTPRGFWIMQRIE
ncbi:MAG: peptidylprolyl isomerase [Polyangiaceae bacterium]|nr:peptidylprolyl isomerase [Polyangiaceae bacterium]